MRAVIVSLLLILVVSTSALPDDRPLNLVVSIEGAVDVQRNNWTGTSPIAFGTVLRLGDLIVPHQRGKVVVLCADLTIATSGPALSGVPCNSGGAILRWNGAKISTARAAVSGYPVLLSPRATDIFEPRPEITWLPISTDARYTVSIEGRNVDWTSQEVREAKLKYPDSAPTLEPDADYQVIIKSDGRSSDEDGVPGSGFRVMSAARLAEVKELERKISDLGLAKSAKQLVLSHIFADRRLLLAAIQQLDGISTSGPVLIFLGELQIRAQRLDLAQETFERALQQLPSTDIENGADCRKTLGRLILAKSPSRAKALLEQASTLYGMLGDAASKAEVTRLLDVLSTQGN